MRYPAASRGRRGMGDLASIRSDPVKKSRLLFVSSCGVPSSSSRPLMKNVGEVKASGVVWGGAETVERRVRIPARLRGESHAR